MLGMSIIFDEDMRKTIFTTAIVPALKSAVKEHNLAQTHVINKEEMPSISVPAPGQFKTLEIPANLIHRFGKHLLSTLKDNDLFEGAFFYHEITNSFEGRYHAHDDHVACLDQLHGMEGITRVLNTRLQHDSGSSKCGSWFVRVGIEFYGDDHVIHWRRAAHSQVLNTIYPCTSSIQFEELIHEQTFKHISDRSQENSYRLDSASSLEQVAGFVYDNHDCLCPTTHCESTHAVIVSCTDREWYVRQSEDVKDFCSAPSFSNFKTAASFDDTMMRPMADIIEALTIVGEIKQDLPRHTKQELGAARLEVIVPLFGAENVLRSFPSSFKQDCLVSFDWKTWW
jgi:hypothetical protein